MTDTAPKPSLASKEESEETPSESVALSLNTKPEEPEPRVEVSPETFREVAYAVLVDELKKWGSPAQYLQKTYPTPESQLEFKELLLEHFPKSPGIDYHSSSELPSNMTDLMALHLSDLGFFARSSTKPAPFLHTSISLLDEYLTNSFLTEQDPVLLAQGPSTSPTPDPFWSIYVKGAARSCTALFLAAQCIKRGWKLAVLRQTCSSRCWWFTHGAVALENARLSSRGAIRKSHCVLTWLGKLSLLREQGLSAENTLKVWNQSCTKESALTGSRRVALLQLLGMPKAAADLLLEHVSLFGDRTAFMEDAFASKRLGVGAMPRSGSKAWNMRLQVTEAGQMLFLRYIHSQHLKRLPGTRAKRSKDDLEEAISMAQLLVSLTDDLTAQMPIASVDAQVFERFVEGDTNLDLELQSALSEKRADFDHGDITIFRELVNEHATSTDRKRQALGMPTSSIAAAQLERQEFDIAMSTLKRDCDAYRIWLTQSRDREAAAYFAELQHQKQRKQKAKDIAKEMGQPSSALWTMQLTKLGKPAACYQEIEGAIKNIMKREQFTSKDQVLSLVVLNWAAPSTFSSEQQACQASLAGALVNDGSGIGAVLTPVYFHKKGALFKVEEAANKQLAGANLNQDHRFALPFQGRNDEREKRTLVQPGRFLVPMEEESYQKVMDIWRTAPLLRKPLAEESVLLATRDMVTIEDIAENALPQTTDTSTHIKPAEKHQQIGVDAARKLLRGFVQGMESSSRASILVVDLSLHSAELCKAALLEHACGQGQLQLPCYYIGFAADEEKLEWANHHMEEFLANSFLDQSLPLPKSASIPPAKLESGLGAAPAASAADGLASLKTPDPLLIKYDESPFRTEFYEILAAAREALPLDLPAEKGAAAQAKRALKMTVEAAAAPLLKKGNKEVCVVISLGSRIWLVNRSDSEQAFEAGTVLAGWYKGKFWHHRNSGEDPKTKKAKKEEGQSNEPGETDVQFKLSDGNDLVSFNGKTTNLASLILEKRKSVPDIGISYHSIVDKPLPGQPGFFGLETKHSIYFRAETIPVKTEDNQQTPKIPLNHLGGCIKASAWDTAATHIVWAVKWNASAQKGLSPVRPVVTLKQTVSLPAQSAVELSQQSASTVTGPSAESE
ncbi:unnamed protein product [Effrenium voratum]|uniref:Uncharacterized protein n=1 Tax=Effrenium voratum TaxID=2562239 RepID=A0AA36MZ55_9DINO|nr:unnamed protein product [Effrenium voratum]